MSELNVNQDNDGTFEMSLRLLGNEVIGFTIKVDDFKSKWLMFSLVALLGVSAIAAYFGPDIVNLFNGTEAVK